MIVYFELLFGKMFGKQTNDLSTRKMMKKKKKGPTFIEKGMMMIFSTNSIHR